MLALRNERANGSLYRRRLSRDCECCRRVTVTGSLDVTVVFQIAINSLIDKAARSMLTAAWIRPTVSKAYRLRGASKDPLRATRPQPNAA